jgi:hypothetical protein
VLNLVFLSRACGGVNDSSPPSVRHGHLVRSENV